MELGGTIKNPLDPPNGHLIWNVKDLKTGANLGGGTEGRCRAGPGHEVVLQQQAVVLAQRRAEQLQRVAWGGGGDFLTPTGGRQVSCQDTQRDPPPPTKEEAETVPRLGSLKSKGETW